jgi:hypothetical protein
MCLAAVRPIVVEPAISMGSKAAALGANRALINHSVVVFAIDLILKRSSPFQHLYSGNKQCRP